MDKYRIDSHKLMFHVDRVSDWLKGKNIYPIYMEVSPAGSCNHRCTYCGLDFMKYQPRFLKTDILKERISELAQLGLKSIMYAGEGEPFLHRDIGDIICHTKQCGIDVAVTTNGTLFKPELADQILGATEWIKVSINGAAKETYTKIHQCREEDYECLMKNLEHAVKVRREKKHRCILGLQLLLLPDNAHEVVPLAKLAKEMGLDYLVVKPYSQHPQSQTQRYSGIKYGDYEYLEDDLRPLNSETFSVVFRIRTMKKWDQADKNYQCCLALPFWSYIDAAGNVWGCSIYLGDDRFFYGNIYEKSFKDIWEGPKRKESLEWMKGHLDVSDCRVNCRMDEINRYLWDLKHLPEHVNFI
jgi:MoaA/NifB/PqqE/SkfB family radical SAM enzyme